MEVTLKVPIGVSVAIDMHISRVPALLASAEIPEVRPPLLGPRLEAARAPPAAGRSRSRSPRRCAEAVNTVLADLGTVVRRYHDEKRSGAPLPPDHGEQFQTAMNSLAHRLRAARNAAAAAAAEIEIASLASDDVDEGGSGGAAGANATGAVESGSA